MLAGRSEAGCDMIYLVTDTAQKQTLFVRGNPGAQAETWGFGHHEEVSWVYSSNGNRRREQEMLIDRNWSRI